MQNLLQELFGIDSSNLVQDRLRVTSLTRWQTMIPDVDTGLVRIVELLSTLSPAAYLATAPQHNYSNDRKGVTRRESILIADTFNVRQIRNMMLR